MKRFWFLPIVPALLLYFISGCGRSVTENGGMNRFADLRKQFAEPPKEYRTVPFYVWNTRVTREEIDRSMADLREKGCGGVILHPRPGMITEYLSDEWYDLFGYAVDKGKELGLDVWIYDENSYPSGFAGGHVPARMPESYNQGQGLRMTRVETLPDTAGSYFLCLKEVDGKWADITDNLQPESGKKGNYCLFSKVYERKSPWYGGFSYVDLLYPGVTDKFIEVTLDGYKERFGDQFGQSIPGWFTDEPYIASPGGIRWTPDLFAVFRQQWGYDLEPNLPSLFEETGDWKRVRHNYTQTLLDLFIDRFARPCYEYCQANNLIFTGHYWEHDWPDVGAGGDNMAMYAWHQMPGIDMLFNQFDEKSPQAQFGNVRAVKELASVANQMGRRRTLSETYGGGTWEETFRDFKRLGDWEYALGVNFMNQHLSHMGIAGARKYDYPPTFSYHSPWWDYYKELNMHYARLSMALSSGEQVNDILVLEPTTSVWLYYSYAGSDPALWKIAENFQAVVTAMEKAQIEYDLGSENIIRDHGRVENGKFVVGKRAYATVVIPPMTENLNASTARLLEEFVAEGGSVLPFSRPTMIDGKEDATLATLWRDEQIPSIDTMDAEGIAVTMKELTSPQVRFDSVHGGNLFHHRRVLKDGQLLFLANSSLDEAVHASIRMKGADVLVMNTLTGTITDYPETVEEGFARFEAQIPPAGSLLLYVADKKQKGFEMPVVPSGFVPVAGGALSVGPAAPNVLTIDFCDLTAGGETTPGLHVYDASMKAFRHNGFAGGNPWNSSVQYKDNINARDTFTTGGFAATYRFMLEKGVKTTGMKAVVERPQLYKVSVNGVEVKPEPGQWFLDRETGVFDIGAVVRQGENSLEIDVSPMKILAEIEPVYILGDFSVIPAAVGWKIAPCEKELGLGSWKAQGMPFYPGTVVYSRTYDVAEPAGHYRVVLGDWAGTVAEVTVNGQSAGIVAFEPYSADVSSLIRKGGNEIAVKVVGSNKNLLGPFHNNPAPGLVTPWLFRNVKECPPGSGYQQLDYGLMDDFSLEATK